MKYSARNSHQFVLEFLDITLLGLTMVMQKYNYNLSLRQCYLRHYEYLKTEITLPPMALTEAQAVIYIFSFPTDTLCARISLGNWNTIK